jgi:hypothetical protein
MATLSGVISSLQKTFLLENIAMGGGTNPPTVGTTNGLILPSEYRLITLSALPQSTGQYFTLARATATGFAGYRPANGFKFAAFGLMYSVRASASGATYLFTTTADAGITAGSLTGQDDFFCIEPPPTSDTYKRALFFTLLGSDNKYISGKFGFSGSGVMMISMFGIETSVTE